MEIEFEENQIELKLIHLAAIPAFISAFEICYLYGFFTEFNIPIFRYIGLHEVLQSFASHFYLYIFIGIFLIGLWSGFTPIFKKIRKNNETSNPSHSKIVRWLMHYVFHITLTGLIVITVIVHKAYAVAIYYSCILFLLIVMEMLFKRMSLANRSIVWATYALLIFSYATGQSRARVQEKYGDDLNFKFENEWVCSGNSNYYVGHFESFLFMYDSEAEMYTAYSMDEITMIQQ